MQNNDIYTDYYVNIIVNSKKNMINKCIKKIYDDSFLEKECPISLVKFKKGDIIFELPCKHYFLEDCLKKWLEHNTTCPLCRFDLKNKPRKDLELLINYIGNLLDDD